MVEQSNMHEILSVSRLRWHGERVRAVDNGLAWSPMCYWIGSRVIRMDHDILAAWLGRLEMCKDAVGALTGLGSVVAKLQRERDRITWSHLRGCQFGSD